MAGQGFKNASGENRVHKLLRRERLRLLLLGLFSQKLPQPGLRRLIAGRQTKPFTALPIPEIAVSAACDQQLAPVRRDAAAAAVLPVQRFRRNRLGLNTHRLPPQAVGLIPAATEQRPAEAQAQHQRQNAKCFLLLHTHISLFRSFLHYSTTARPPLQEQITQYAPPTRPLPRKERPSRIWEGRL